MAGNFSARSGTRAAITLWFGTRGFFGVTRSIHTQTNALSFPLRWTPNANRPGTGSAPGSDNLTRRTSDCVAIDRAWIDRVPVTGEDGWQDSELLESLALGAPSVALSEGQIASLSLRIDR
jgi:hypothetical protein